MVSVLKYFPSEHWDFALWSSSFWSCLENVNVIMIPDLLYVASSLCLFLDAFRISSILVSWNFTIMCPVLSFLKILFWSLCPAVPHHCLVLCLQCFPSLHSIPLHRGQNPQPPYLLEVEAAHLRVMWGNLDNLREISLDSDTWGGLCPQEMGAVSFWRSLTPMSKTLIQPSSPQPCPLSSPPQVFWLDWCELGSEHLWFASF